MVGTLSTAIAGVTAVLDEKCILTGRSAAYCNYTYSGDLSGSTTSTSYTTIITGSLYYEYPVIVTAGAEKLSSAVETSVSGGMAPVVSSLTSGTSFRGRSLESNVRVFAIAMAVVTYFQGLVP